MRVQGGGACHEIAQALTTLAEIELLGSEFDPNAKGKDAAEGETAEAKPKKTVGGRIRQAIAGGRTKKAETTTKAKVDKSTKGGKRVTTPRKAGGS